MDLKVVQKCYIRLAYTSLNYKNLTETAWITVMIWSRQIQWQILKIN